MTPSAALPALAASYVLNVFLVVIVVVGAAACFGFFVFMAQTVWPFIFMWRSLPPLAVAVAVAVSVSAACMHLRGALQLSELIGNTVGFPY